MTSPLRIGTSVTSDKSLKVVVLRGLNFIVGSVGCFTILRLRVVFFDYKNFEVKISKFKLNYHLTSKTALPNILKIVSNQRIFPKN